MAGFDVEIEVLSARKLIAVDRDGTSDPFVTVQLLAVGANGMLSAYKTPWKKARSTKEKRRTLSPVWRSDDNNRFEFRGVSGALPAVRFRVMDWNRWSPPKPMGEFVVRLTGETEEVDWHELKVPADMRRLPAGRSLGEVEVKISVTPSGKKKRAPRKEPAAHKWFEPDEAERTPNVLQVAIVSATGFPESHRPLSTERRKSIRCDPLAVVRYRGEKRSTKVLKRTLQPIWGTTFDLPRGPDGSDVLTIDVCDTRLFKEPKRLGRVQVDCKTSSPVARDYDLDPKGSITLAWKLAYDPSYDQTAEAEWFAHYAAAHTPDDVPDEAVPEVVHVVAVRARGLRAADAAMFGREATSDPYVKLRVVRHDPDFPPDSVAAYEDELRDNASSWVQTDVVKRSLAPVWNARFTLPLGDLYGSSLVDEDDEDDAGNYAIYLEVYDRDYFGSDDFLGQAVINLAATVGEERRRVTRATWIPLEGDEATGEILLATKTVCHNYTPGASQRGARSPASPPSTDVALPARPAAEPRPAAPSWRPFAAAEDLLSGSPNELRIGLRRASGLPTGVDGCVTVVFAVVSKAGEGNDDDNAVLLEWQSGQARLFRPTSGDGNDSYHEATWQQSFAWPLCATKRDQDFELAVTLATVPEDSSEGGGPSTGHLKLSGRHALASVVDMRPAVSVVGVPLFATVSGDASSSSTMTLELIVQWRHNRYIATRDHRDLEEVDAEPAADDSPPPPPGSDPAATSEAPDAPAPAPAAAVPKRRFRRSSLKSVVQHHMLGATTFRVNHKANLDVLYSFAAFVPAFVMREIVKKRTDGGTRERVITEGATRADMYGRAMTSESKAEAAVLFADISGFTKLTEKLNQRLNGAELLCSELDVVYAALCEEADALGGDAVKFAGDAICFTWVVEGPQGGGRDLREATRRAALAARRMHSRIKRRPAVEGVKLTLHAGLGAGPLTLLTITRARPAGQRQRSEFIVAGLPLDQIAIAEPLASPGQTVCSPEAWEHLEDVFDGVLISDLMGEGKDDPPTAKADAAADYVCIGDIVESDEADVVDPPPMPLLAATVQSLDPGDLELVAPFVPRAFERILRSPHATATFIEHAKHAKAEIRELTVAFLCFRGVRVADEPHKAQAMVSCVDWCVRNFDGNVNKFIVDDKGTLALVVFGLPTSVHENAATRCLAAIRLLFLNLPNLDMSCWAGVTTAKTFCGAVGSSRRMEYTVMGDSVNLAARLMAACGKSAATDANAVIVDEGTSVATGDEVEYETLDPIKVKGKQNLVAIFSPSGWKHRRVHSPNAMLRGTRFATQTANLHQLEAVFDRVFEKPKSPPFLGNKTAESSRLVSTCVVCAKGGNAFTAVEMMENFPTLCHQRGVALLRSLPSQSIFDDGWLKATTLCGAWRRPVAAALDVIAAGDAAAETLAAGGLPDFATGLKGREAAIAVAVPQAASAAALEEVFLSNEAPEKLGVGGSVLPAAPLANDAAGLETRWHSSLRLVSRSGIADDGTLTAATSRHHVSHLPPIPEPASRADGSTSPTPASTIRRSGQIAAIVFEVIMRAAESAPVCILLDNLAQMDGASWDVVELLMRAGRRRSGDAGSSRYLSSRSLSCDDVAPRHPVLLCLLAPATRDEGVHRAEWFAAREAAQDANLVVEACPLETDEALTFTAEALELCKIDDDEMVRKAAVDRVAAVPDLTDFVREAGGVRDILYDMLQDARRCRAIRVEDDGRIVVERLAELHPPPRHAAPALAAIDDALPVHQQIVVKAASVFKGAFTPTLVHNLAPINIEPRHIKDLFRALCEPLDSGKTVLVSRQRGDWCSHLRAAGSSKSDVDNEVFQFNESYTQKAIADTLLDSQIVHVMQKTDTLPIAGLTAKSWANELLHPFLLRKYHDIRMQSGRIVAQRFEQA